jgi:glycosyltransferase involved in cell wall biosynthesis
MDSAHIAERALSDHETMTTISPRGPQSVAEPLRMQLPGSTAWAIAITAGSIVAAVVLGVGLVLSATLTTGLVIAVIAVGLLVWLPVRYMAVILLLVTALVPSVILTHPSGLSSILGGTLKTIGIFTCITLLKATLQQRGWSRPQAIGLLVVGLSVIAITLSAVVASFASHSPSGLIGNVLRALALILAGLVGFVSVMAAPRASERASMYRWMTIGTTLIAVSGLVYWAWLKSALPAPPGLESVFSMLRSTSKYTSGGRANFPYVEDAPNLDAVAYILIAAFAIPALLANSLRGRDKVIAATALIATIAAVATTGSRTGFLCMGSAFAAFLVFRPNRGHRRQRVLLVGMLAVLSIYLSPVVFPRASQLSTGDTTFVARTEIWTQAWQDFSDKPLLGWGFGYSGGERFSERAAPGATATARLNSVHNQYLGQLVDGGAVGLMLLGTVCFLLVIVAMRLSRVPKSAGEGLGFGYFLTVLAVSSIDGATLASAACGTIIWLICGMAIGRLTQVSHASANRVSVQPKTARRSDTRRSSPAPDGGQVPRLSVAEVAKLPLTTSLPESRAPQMSSIPVDDRLPPLRVLFCTLDYYPAVAGGAEHQARLQAEALARLGHEVSVVCPGRHLPKRDSVNNVSVRRLPFVDRRPFRRLTYYLRLIPFLLGRARHFDIVHVHLANVQADIIVALCNFAGTPVYVKCACGGTVGEVARGNRHFAKITRWYGLRHAAGVQALSSEIEAELLSVGTPADRVARIPNGIDLGHFEPATDEQLWVARDRLGLPQEKLIVMFVGRFAVYKGLGDLQAAWARVVLADAVLVLVGEPIAGESALDRPANPIESTDTVFVRGWTADVRSYLHAADVYVHPTHGDGMSNALLEAMACGLAIVATRLGSTEGLLEHERDALLVAPASPDQLAKAIQRLAGDPDLRARLGTGAIETSRQFEIDTVVGRIEDAYRRILADR